MTICVSYIESGSCSEVSKAGPPNKLHGPGEGSAVLLVKPIKKLQGRGMKESKVKAKTYMLFCTIAACDILTLFRIFCFI